MQADTKLSEIKKNLDSGEDAEKVSVPEFLSWFDAQRRGSGVVARIRRELEKHSLETDPDFESAYLHSSILVKARKSSQLAIDQDPQSENNTLEEPEFDPAYRISKLKAANNMPVWVEPTVSLSHAVTLMMDNDYSQLPVMTNERNLKGLISWKTIGQGLALGKSGSTAKDFMGHAPPLLYNTESIFSIIQQIKKDDCVIVKNKMNIIMGIITSADLSEQFGVLSHPFMTLGEIENRIRKLLRNNFDVNEINQVLDREKEIESVDELSMGDYRRLMEKPERWDRLGLRLERKVFIDSLDNVRQIRNRLMHFDPDGVESEDIVKLNNFCEFLRSLDERGLFKGGVARTS